LFEAWDVETWDQGQAQEAAPTALPVRITLPLSSIAQPKKLRARRTLRLLAAVWLVERAFEIKLLGF